MNALPTPSGGTATFARFVDYLGYSMIKECRVKYGTSTLQTLTRDSLFLYHNLYLDDQSQAREDVNVCGNVIPAKRSWQARQKIFFKVPLHHGFWQDDLSKALKVQGLTQKLMIEFDFVSAGEIIQTDGTSNNVFLSDTSAYFNSLYLQGEFYHVLRAERDRGIAHMAAPDGLRYLFDNVQV